MDCCIIKVWFACRRTSSYNYVLKTPMYIVLLEMEVWNTLWKRLTSERLRSMIRMVVLPRVPSSYSEHCVLWARESVGVRKRLGLGSHAALTTCLKRLETREDIYTLPMSTVHQIFQGFPLSTILDVFAFFSFILVPTVHTVINTCCWSCDEFNTCVCNSVTKWYMYLNNEFRVEWIMWQWRFEFPLKNVKQWAFITKIQTSSVLGWDHTSFVFKMATKWTGRAQSSIWGYCCSRTTKQIENIQTARIFSRSVHTHEASCTSPGGRILWSFACMRTWQNERQVHRLSFESVVPRMCIHWQSVAMCAKQKQTPLIYLWGNLSLGLYIFGWCMNTMALLESTHRRWNKRQDLRLPLRLLP